MKRYKQEPPLASVNSKKTKSLVPVPYLQIVKFKLIANNKTGIFKKYYRDNLKNIIKCVGTVKYNNEFDLKNLKNNLNYKINNLYVQNSKH